MPPIKSVPGIAISPFRVFFDMVPIVSGARSLDAGRHAPPRWTLDSWAIRRDAGGVDDKAIRRKTRKLADQAYEEELRRALKKKTAK